MMMKRLYFLLPLMILLAACAPAPASTPAPAPSATAQPTPTSTTTPQPTNTATHQPPLSSATATQTLTPEPTLTNTSFSTNTLTATPELQYLGALFPDYCSGQAVWTSADGGSPGNPHTGWRDFGGGNDGFYIHYDITPPMSCRDEFGNIPVLSPIDGKILDIFQPGDGTEGFEVTIQFLGSPQNLVGLENIFSVDAISEIAFLESKGISNNETGEYFPQIFYGMNLSDVLEIRLPIAHIYPIEGLHKGDVIQQSQYIGYVQEDGPHNVIVAMPITLIMNHPDYIFGDHGGKGIIFQFDPCMLGSGNLGKYCGIEANGSPFRTNPMGDYP